MKKTNHVRALEFFSSLKWLLLPETIIATFWHADWQGAFQQRGATGIISEGLHSFIGTNSYPFFVASDPGWNGFTIKKLLAEHGIKIWGVGYRNGHFFFRVKRSQAHWAEYVMLREGVPLVDHLQSSNYSHQGLGHAGPRPQRQSNQAMSTHKNFDLLAKIDQFADKLNRAFE